ncbi:MAG: NYN domain-containing protein [Phycisphaerales bacterium]|nr:NYN domain-containing protein [Phycisphaerales bacterium]
MPLLLDCYNILHVVGVLPPDLAGIDTDGLVALVGRSRWRDSECWVICDGTPKGRRHQSLGRIQVKYAGPGRTADEAIEQLVSGSSAPRGILVVSNDREVQRSGRRRRCQVLDADTFLAHLAEDAQRGPGREPDRARPEVPLDPEQVDQWVDAFGVNDVLHLQATAPPPPLPPEQPPDPPQAPEPETPEPPDPRRVLDADRTEDITLEDLDALDMGKVIDDHGQWRDNADEQDDS